VLEKRHQISQTLAEPLPRPVGEGCKHQNGDRERLLQDLLR
jgi:hypothetical protein